MLTNKLCSLLNLFGLGVIGMREHDCRSMLYLIVEKFSEILHIHFALTCINNGGEAIKHSVFGCCALCRANNVRKLADSRGLNDNPIGVIFSQHLTESLGKITDKRAADTA